MTYNTPQTEIINDHGRSKWPTDLKNVALDKDYITKTYVKEAPKPTVVAEPASASPKESHSIDAAFTAKFQQFEKECEHNFRELYNMVVSQKNDLQRSVSELSQKVKEMEEKVTALKNAPRPAPQVTVTESAAPATAEPPKNMDKPIDRNNVAPASVAIDKIFNFSNKKF